MTDTSIKEDILLKHSIDRATDRNKFIEHRSLKDLTQILSVVERFIRKEKVMCYGGTAINAVLKDEDKFYNPKLEVPDYDFFSLDAIKLTNRLADVYSKNPKYTVDAKSGVHFGTYKVFVNFIPMADITQLTPLLFSNLWEERIVIDRINYVPINFLRWSMYLELSRPKGDVGRWEKVAQRLKRLNSTYPIITCKDIRSVLYKFPTNNTVFEKVRKKLIKCDVIFFGRYAHQEYRREAYNEKIHQIPFFEVISKDANSVSQKLLKSLGKTYNVGSLIVPKIGEQLPARRTILIDNRPVVHIYNSSSCYSYNHLKLKSLNAKIATIESFLSFYLLFLYVDKHYDSKPDILCIVNDVLTIQNKHRLSTAGLLRRYVTDCIGNQVTQRDILSERAAKYTELMHRKNTPEYQTWFYKWTKSKKRRPNSTRKKAVAKRTIRKATRKSRRVPPKPRRRSASRTRKNARKRRSRKLKGGIVSSNTNDITQLDLPNSERAFSIQKPVMTGNATILPRSLVRPSATLLGKHKCPIRTSSHNDIQDSDISSLVPDEFIFYMHQLGTERIYNWDADPHPYGFKYMIGVSSMFPQLGFVNGTRKLHEWKSNINEQNYLGALNCSSDELSSDSGIVRKYLENNPQITDLIAHSRGFPVAIEAVRKLYKDTSRRIYVCGVDGAVPIISYDNDYEMSHCGTRNISSNSEFDKLLSAKWTMNEKDNVTVKSSNDLAVKAGHRQYVLPYTKKYITKSKCNMNDVAIRMTYCSGFPGPKKPSDKGMCRLGRIPRPFSNYNGLLLDLDGGEGSIIFVGRSFIVRNGTIKTANGDISILDHALFRLGDPFLYEPNNKDALLAFDRDKFDRENGVDPSWKDADVDLCWIFFMEHLIPLFAEKLRSELLSTSFSK